jgi:hypothetical protein
MHILLMSISTQVDSIKTNSFWICSDLMFCLLIMLQ